MQESKSVVKIMRLIDAENMRVLEDLEYNYNPVKDGEPWYKAEDVWDCIEKEPTIDPESLITHGRWDLHHVGVGHYWECSVCHANPQIYITKDTKYCPNCGAKMDLED